jgi:D-hydroxyproline dehydrogenase subunit gamma
MQPAPETVDVVIDGIPVRVIAGTTVAAAILIAGKEHFRTSVSGEARGPLCGMGVCFECRVTIDGVAHCRSCQILCRNGMDVRTT